MTEATKKKLICKSAGECKDKNCDHIAEHWRDYVCSHWCNEKRAIISCRVVG